MNYLMENGKLIIHVDGSIDSTNAEEIGKEILEIRTANPHDSLELDLENLRYISSAGLRQILQMKKTEKDFTIINVPSEVYEILEMTGFTEMMDIRKAYRKMSLEGCEIIGEGSNGIVYRYSPDTIVKVYKNQDALQDIERERELSRRALILGINTAIPFDIVLADGKLASVFELLNVKSINKLIREDAENIDKYVWVSVDTLKNIHNTTIDNSLFPSNKARYVDYCKFLEDRNCLPDETISKLKKMVDDIPEDNHVVHGDYHVNNVMYADNEVTLIDMDTLSTGNPIFDFANIILAYHGFGLADHSKVENFMKTDWDTCQNILQKTFEMYFDGKTKEEISEIIEKASVLGYTRLLRRTLKREPENTALIEACKEKLIEGVNKVDTLAV